MIFPKNINDGYIVLSLYYNYDDEEKTYTKILSLNENKFIKYIYKEEGNITEEIKFILSWYNDKNNKYYIIQFFCFKILIISLENELYCKLEYGFGSYPHSGYIYTVYNNKENNDYMCFSGKDSICIFDLYSKKIINKIKFLSSGLENIIQWNNKYSLVIFNESKTENRSIKIIDFEKSKIINVIKGKNINFPRSMKKIYHPIYGESLLISGKDNIKLWTI